MLGEKSAPAGRRPPTPGVFSAAARRDRGRTIPSSQTTALVMIRASPAVRLLDASDSFGGAYVAHLVAAQFRRI